ncbi:GFA family protein [Aggregicoccus sp. 17bor-14]|uniref:GFA family protein n=1 Tax=Myxococcaceae TaxID=31 RepID=UPI00129CAA38|nr:MULTISPECIES: GFA family protein [Myxococcaceae]MBF5043195.1 GFA family protein [Simulacricoccus sp. 17bor-14]MRI88953.1 GFA family protein [Aggregicoccus sp. 17bor-14]
MSQPRPKSPNPSGLQHHAGGCVCGAVRLEAELDLDAGATRCNCSICQKLGATGVLLKPQQLRVLSGEESLGSYGREGSPNRRYFCRACGTYLFGRGDVPELGGAFASVNVNCLDAVDVGALQVGYWDGRHDNWAAGLRPTPWPVRA